MSRSLCWILSIFILFTSILNPAYSSSKSGTITGYLDPYRRTKYHDPDQLVGYRPFQRNHLQYFRPNMPMLLDPQEVFYQPPNAPNNNWEPLWFGYSKELWAEYYKDPKNKPPSRARMQQGMSPQGISINSNRNIWTYIPPHRFHLSDLVYDHQNSVGGLYLYLNRPTPLPTLPPIQMVIPASTQAPKEEPKSSVIVLGPSELPRPAPTPVPFGKSLNTARNNFQAGQYVQAAKSFEAAAQSQPENPVVYMGLMFSYLGNKEYAKASATLHQALSLHEEWYKTPMNLALLRVSPTDFQSQIQALEQFLGDNAQDTEAQFLLGYCYFIAGNKDKAKAIIDTLVQQKPIYKEVMKLSQSFIES